MRRAAKYRRYGYGYVPTFFTQPFRDLENNSKLQRGVKKYIQSLVKRGITLDSRNLSAKLQERRHKILQPSNPEPRTQKVLAELPVTTHEAMVRNYPHLGRGAGVGLRGTLRLREVCQFGCLFLEIAISKSERGLRDDPRSNHR